MAINMISESIGALIRTNRLLRYLSLSTFSEMCNVSISYLSEIETNKKKPDIAIIKRIMASLDIAYNDSPELITYAQNIFETFYHEIYFGRFDKAKAIYEEVRLKENEFFSSPCISLYNLICYIYEIIIGHDKKRETQLELLLSDYVDDLDSRYKQAYFLYSGTALFHKGNLNEAYHRLISALNMGVSSEFTSLIYYNLGIISQMLNNSIIALDYSKEAKKIFDNDCNYRKSLFSYIHIGISYLNLSEMEKAEEIFLHCYEIATTLNNTEAPPIVSVNLSWLYLLTQDYEKVGLYVQKAIDYGSPNPGIYIHNSIALMKLGKVDEAKKYISLGREKSKDILDLVLLNYVEKTLSGDMNEIKKCLYDMGDYMKANSSLDNQSRKFQLKELICVLESNGEFEEACHYYKELLALKN